MGALLLLVADLLREGRAAPSTKKKKRKKIFGLSDTGSPLEASDETGSDEADDGNGMAGQLRGVKGAMLQERLDKAMTTHPEEFYTDMRRRMIKHLAKDGDGPQRAFQFSQQMPLEKQKVLGYFAWTLSHIDSLLYQGRTSEAKLGVLRGLACIDQHLLDGHWTTAWPLVGAGREPPWPVWEQSSAQVYKRTNTTSALLNEAWVSASLSKIKDDQFFRKQRFSGNRDPKKDKDKDQEGGDGEAPPGGGGGGRGGRRGR